MADKVHRAFLLTIFLLGFVLAEGQVQLAVYYESLCPDSDSFFHNQLWPTYKKIPEYMSIELIPYGNAHYRGQHDEYTFTCQHGPNECYGNLVQTCFITLVNDTSRQIKFINCAFDSPSQQKSMERCIDSVDLRRQVKKCITSPLGRNGEYEMAKKTEALNPKHSFIPWITVNGEGSESLTFRATDDLLSVVCEAIKGEKPAVCIQNRWNVFKKFRNYYL